MITAMRTFGGTPRRCELHPYPLDRVRYLGSNAAGPGPDVGPQEVCVVLTANWSAQTMVVAKCSDLPEGFDRFEATRTVPTIETNLTHELWELVE